MIRMDDLEGKVFMPELKIDPGENWQEGDGPNRWTRSYADQRTQGNLQVLIGDERHDGRWWRRISLSRPDRVPDYRDIANVKNCFVGRDSCAIMVMEAADRQTDTHPFCIHLYQPLDHNPLPDFRWIDGEPV